VLARNPTRRAIEIAFIYLVLTAGAIMSITPLLWAISTSLKTAGKEFVIPIELIPRPATLDNYRELFSHPIVKFGRAFRNTFIVSVPTTLGVIFVSSLAGFAFAKLKFPGRDAIFMVLLGTMMIPMAVRLIPQYLLMKAIGWLNTYYPLIIPVIMTSVFGTFLMRQFMMTLPNDLLDSARVDGIRPFRMYTLLALPLAKPALITLSILTFMTSWNNFFLAIVYLTRPRMFVLQQSLAYMNSEYGVEWRLLMAGTVVAVLPVIGLFLALQKYYVQGITMSGLKG
jgi:ABC-type glycerol-3-phosphate transport system permease component